MCTLASFYPPAGVEYTIFSCAGLRVRLYTGVNIIFVIRSLKLFEYYANDLFSEVLISARTNRITKDNEHLLRLQCSYGFI